MSKQYRFETLQLHAGQTVIQQVLVQYLFTKLHLSYLKTQKKQQVVLP